MYYLSLTLTTVFFLIMSSTAQAACSGTCVGPVTVTTVISTTGNAPIESPVILYANGWAPVITDTPINFGTVDPSTTTPGQTYNVTFGTLDLNLGSLSIQGSSANSTTASPYNLVDQAGDQIAYTVSYTDCNNTTHFITPTLPPAFTGIIMAGDNPACHPQSSSSPGSGAGQLTFNLVPSSAPVTAGTYSDILTLTISNSTATSA